MYREYGYSFPEVLISLFLFSSTVLGTAAARLSAMQWLDEAYQYAQAEQLAHDMMERMRVNPAALALYANDRLGRSELLLNADCRQQFCSPEVLAAFDLWQWEQWLTGQDGVPQSLPDPLACITVNNRWVQITVSWLQRKGGGDQPDCYSPERLSVQYQAML